MKVSLSDQAMQPALRMPMPRESEARKIAEAILPWGHDAGNDAPADHHANVMTHRNRHRDRQGIADHRAA